MLTSVFIASLRPTPDRDRSDVSYSLLQTLVDLRTPECVEHPISSLDCLLWQSVVSKPRTPSKQGGP